MLDTIEIEGDKTNKIKVAKISDPKKLLKKNLLSLAIVQISSYGLPLISVPIVSRIIGPEKFGEINFGVAFITYFTLIISYSFEFSATRKLTKDAENSDKRNVIFSEVFFTQSYLLIFSTIIFITILYTIQELENKKTILVFSYLICISTLFTQNWLYQAMQDLTKVAIFNLVSKLLFTIAIILVIEKEEDYIWQPFLIGSIQILIAIWSFSWSIKKYKLKFIKTPINRCIQLLKEEKTIFISLIFVNLYSSTNTVFLGAYTNSENVGYFTAAQRLIIIAISVLTMPLSQAFYPYIGKAFGESKDQGIKVAQKLIPLIISFLGLATVTMYLIGPTIIRLFYGNKFEEAILIFQLLTIIPLLFSLNNVLGIQIMVNLGMDKEFMKVSACAAALSIILNILFVEKYNYLGTACIWLITELFLLISMYILLRIKGLDPVNFKYFNFKHIMSYILTRNKIIAIEK